MLDILGYEIYEGVTVRDALTVVVVMLIAVFIARVVTINVRRALADKVRRDQLEIVAKVIYYGIIVVAFLGVTPLLGLNLSGLLVAGGIAGIVIGFASQSVVSNFVSGLFLLWERPIKIGDAIQVEGVSGIVEDIHVMSTVVRTFNGLYVRIPNEKMFTSNIVNYVANVARRIEYIIGISYDDDADKAVEVIKGVIEEEPFALKEPSPDVFVDNLGDSSVNIVVRFWAPVSEWYDVKKRLLWKIKVELEKNGITIPFPQRVLWFANEVRVKES
ncbi:mechanosensitive ion channel family protein [Archaeoglobus profundus]|uniref:MscS Mechanosensitive ion channel n=1 Tax=Archaeoglobus profundus (strain DSM 5631 / JCM 9629 / NBRC 100127 / Av18) TaxID=572546 RepID=D2RDV6_ARCPA|nr:mechanosensitive ion channel family protein [Archaeoglobus profundus]ADB58300.1 MscS Mechanosensitive ion channel [Archaeoglobus profundus DSM 5631]